MVAPNENHQCNHLNTYTFAKVDLLVKDDVIVGYQFIARVKCRDCGIPFNFRHLFEIPSKVAWWPSTKDHGMELVIPIAPGPLDTTKN